ncbi:MAG: DEAD/DEAH box helicase [Thermoguttaceae bacterium]|nr:DEAD/DEAH box helicase [Thermoguttaceae bacterium]MDW8038661.1 DEAD/DEAH box helicase [Thermoguttaceae bacterium]
MGVELFTHQRKGIERALAKKRLLLIRPLGSGKTAIGLHIAARLLKEPGSVVLWVAPAHLLPQLLQEQERWSVDYPVEIVQKVPPAVIPGTLYAMSYDRLRLSRSWVEQQKWKCLIVDEVHHAKNLKTQNHVVLKKLSSSSEFFIGMTGAPFQNSPFEFFNLVALIAGRPLQKPLEACLAYKYERKYPFWLRWIRALFRLRPHRGPVSGIRDPIRLTSLLLPYVDYVSDQQCAGECGLPKIISQTIQVEMTPYEVKVYRRLASKHRKKIDRQFLTDDLEENCVERAFHRVADLRQTLLETLEGPSSKVKALVEHVQKIIDKQINPKVLIFTNFVEHGVLPISRCLEARCLPHVVYTGEVNVESKVKIIETFKTGQTPILLLSPVGFEGLDLVGTTRLFIADPHYNPEVTSQLIARATRAGGTIKEVYVFHYVSCSRHLEKGTIDEAIQRIAGRKAEVNRKIQALLESSGESI